VAREDEFTTTPLMFADKTALFGMVSKILVVVDVHPLFRVIPVICVLSADSVTEAEYSAVAMHVSRSCRSIYTFPNPLADGDCTGSVRYVNRTVNTSVTRNDAREPAAPLFVV